MNSDAEEVVHSAGFSPNFGVAFVSGWHAAESFDFSEEQYKTIVQVLVQEGLSEEELSEMLSGSGLEKFLALTFEINYVEKAGIKLAHPRGLYEKMFGVSETQRLIKNFGNDISSGRVDWHEALRKYRQLTSARANEARRQEKSHGKAARTLESE
jgi:hypothetical protein